MKITLHAYNLINPSHMEWTIDGKLIVSEHTAGRVKDVTDGGNMLNVDALIENLEGPAAIVPLPDGRILITEAWGGRISEISSGRQTFIDRLELPYSLYVVEPGERIFVSQLDQNMTGWITDVTSGAKSADHRVVLRNIPSRPGMPGLTPISAWPNWQSKAAAGCIANWGGGGGGRAFTSIGAMGQIIEVTNCPIEYIDAVRSEALIAWGLNRLGAIKYNTNDGYIYATEPESGNVLRIDPSNRMDYRMQGPLIRGINMPSCVRFSSDGKEMFVCSQGDGVVWRIEGF